MRNYRASQGAKINRTKRQSLNTIFLDPVTELP